MEPEDADSDVVMAAGILVNVTTIIQVLPGFKHSECNVFTAPHSPCLAQNTLRGTL